MPSRREKRIARQIEAVQKFEEKRAYSVEKILEKKAPYQSVRPEPKKIPVEYRAGESRYPFFLKYSKDREDRDGSWTWGQPRDWHPAPGNNLVYNYLNGYKLKTWAEIHAEVVGKKKRGGKTDIRHKFYTQGQLCEEAQYRLIELKLDDIETIFRFRMSGKQRLFGFILGITFNTVWYDRLHKIYPSER